MNSCQYGIPGDFNTDSSGFYSTNFYKAKKIYFCCECRGVIKKGVKYKRVVYGYDGEISTSRFCLSCGDLTEKLFCEGWIIGEALDTLDEYLPVVYDNGEACFENWVTENQSKLSDGKEAFFNAIQNFLDKNHMTPAKYWEKFWSITTKTSPDWSISLFNTMYKIGKRVWWENAGNLVLCKTNMPAFQRGSIAAISVDACPSGPVKLLSVMPEEVLI